METIDVKYQTLNMAINRLGQSLEFFKLVKSKSNNQDDIAYTVARDSIIQRFEFSVELFWKYLRVYLEFREKIDVSVNSPRAVIRTACQARIINEEQATNYMSMIASRNLTSHIYKEDIAEQLARDIPNYYEQIKQITVVLKP